MAADADYIRAIYEAELGQPQGSDEAGVRYWQGTGLTGVDLIKNMRYSAGLNNAAFDDPAFNAFHRSLISKRAELGADRASRLAQIARARALASGTQGERQTQDLRRVDSDFEGRGMFRAGGRLASRADVQRASSLAAATQDESFNNQQEDITRETSSALADLSRRRDEEEIAARNRLTDRSIMKSLGG
jgi:hypothetical protein